MTPPVFSSLFTPEAYKAQGGQKSEPAIQPPPFAVLPPVTLEGVRPTETVPPRTKDDKPAAKNTRAVVRR